MPLYIPWLTETIKKRGVRYLLHHYLGQFFLEKLTLEQLSIDIYEGKGSIRDLALDVDGLNDELDFIPFTFLDGCSIGQISVEVPWGSLATEACRVELDGARFVCRIKTSSDSNKAHCAESTLLSRSLMTSSMQMAEEIVTTEDDDEYDSPDHSAMFRNRAKEDHSKKDANQMFEGLEMFAQLIDSVLRRTKLTARNTLFTIQPHCEEPDQDEGDDDDDRDSQEGRRTPRRKSSYKSSNSDEFSEPLARSDAENEEEEDQDEDDQRSLASGAHSQVGGDKTNNTVEFFIKFFRCEEIVDQTSRTGDDYQANRASDDIELEELESQLKKSSIGLPETVTKLLTLEDVEMRIGGIPVSNLTGKHTITIKFNGHKSEISIFSGSPLLAVISHKQLETFFNVFDGVKDRDSEYNLLSDKDQKVMSPEDYAKIENQLLESASLRNVNNVAANDFGSVANGSLSSAAIPSNYVGSGRRWVDTTTATPATSDIHSGKISWPSRRSQADKQHDYCSGNSPSNLLNSFESAQTNQQYTHRTQMNDEQHNKSETTLENIEAFSCELKLPGIWLCILRDGEALPPLIKPYADSINSFQTINKYIDEHIRVPHIRCLALKVALDLTSHGINIFLGDLDISEYLQDESKLNQKLRILQNDLTTNVTLNSARYKATIVDNREITLDLFTKTRVMFDPTMIDRLVYDYKLIKLNDKSSHHHVNHRRRQSTLSSTSQQQHHQRINSNNNLDLNLTIRGEQFKLELLCPIPDLTPEAHLRAAQLRPQSFLFDLRNVQISWQCDKLNVSSDELLAYVKTQPKQSDNEAIKFIESTGRNNDKITLIMEPSPSNLDTEFPSEVEHALNESSLYDSIYVSQATESRIPTEPFQTKRKVVRASFESQKTSNKPDSARLSECDHEKILTPGDRQHLLDYLHQTVMSTKMGLSLHLPICEIEFEDKEQLDLIYNRFGNDFVFWQPRALSSSSDGSLVENMSKKSSQKKRRSSIKGDKRFKFKQPRQSDDSSRSSSSSSSSDDDIEEEDDSDDDANSDVSYHSVGFRAGASSSAGDLNSVGSCYDNQVSCKIMVDELFVRFNHQSCAAALKQEISADNLLLGVVIDVNKKPNTLLSLVADNLELSSDSDVVLEGNTFGEKSSTFSLTAEIKRPTRELKDIKLAIQLKSGLFKDFKSETYKRFWQSINVTDEPILGYVAPRIVTELHIDILNTCLQVTKDGARPALLAIDELYLTSMVMEETSQVMIRLIADEVSLYLKRNRDGFEQMKNYICLIDSGLIDLDVKFSQDGKLQFGVINNVITVRVCQDSLSALCKLFNVITRGDKRSAGAVAVAAEQLVDGPGQSRETVTINSKAGVGGDLSGPDQSSARQRSSEVKSNGPSGREINCPGELNDKYRDRQKNLLADAMNDYNLDPPSASKSGAPTNDTCVVANNIYDERDDSDDERNVSEMDEERDEDDYENHYDEEEDEGDGDDDDDDDDNEGPPVMQKAPRRSSKQAKPSACILDQSNPLLGDVFAPPLLPLPQLDGHHENEQQAGAMNQSSRSTTTTTTTTTDKGLGRASMCESGFFVIGDDDVGAGIIDKQRQHEPVVRKLIDGPINIIENHFKMTKPRTIPEMLANSLERYVLEEMTLVVNLYGGRDFDDEDPSEDAVSTTTEAGDQAADQAELIGGGSGTSEAGLSAIRSRTGSLAAGQTTLGIRKQTLSDLNGSLKRKGSSGTGGGGVGPAANRGARRKHLSEGSGAGAAIGGRVDRSSRYSASIVEPRVRFGEGAMNLWESLDLMSSPDFLGARPRPSQPALNSDLKQAGGTWRQNDVCIQLTLSKMKLLYELADVTSASAGATPSGVQSATIGHLSTTKAAAAPAPTATSSSSCTSSGPISWRFMLFIHDIEVKDRIAASDINKMLYEYCTESMPKRSTQFLTINNIATINPTDGCEECNLRVSLKPLRLNIDQDTLVFLIEFFNTFCKSLTKQQLQQQSIYSSQAATTVTGSGSSTTTTTTSAVQTKSAPGTYPDNRTNSATISCDHKYDDDGALGESAGGQVRSGQDCSQHHLKQTTSRREKVSRGTNGSEEENDVAACSLSASNRSGTTPTTVPTTTTTITSNSGKSTEVGHLLEDLASSSACSSPSSSSPSSLSSRPSSLEDEPTNCTPLPTHCHKDNVNGSANQQPIYIKSFTFSPDVPIRLDYHAKHLDFEQGALAGILMGLAHLDHSELILKRVQAKHGMRGLDRVLVFVLNSWLNDIKRNQLPSILSGVGPMHSVIQLFQGMRDLIWMPIDHYRKDKRLVRGLQRGASSFSSSTAMAAINLVNRFISIVQCTAQIAHDIVTPPNVGLGEAKNNNSIAGGHRNHHGAHRRHQHHRRSLKSLGGGAGSNQSMSSISDIGSRRHHRHSNGGSSGLAGPPGANIISQPRNFCEGVAVGFTIIKEGLEDTARNVTVGMQAEDMRSAVGELVRQIPSTLLNPIISATEGAQSVLVGIRNQIAPDARREDQEKWKRRVRGK